MKYSLILVLSSCFAFAISPKTASAEGAGCHITCEAMCEVGGDLYDPSVSQENCMKSCTSGCADEPSDPGGSDIDDETRCRGAAQRCDAQCESNEDPKCFQYCMASEVCDF